MSRPARFDQKSSKIKISTYRGSTLQCPDAVISRKVYANENYAGANNVNFSTTVQNPRYLQWGTSEGKGVFGVPLDMFSPCRTV